MSESVRTLHLVAENDGETARAEILAALGDISGVRVWDQFVLGAIYHRPTKIGGIEIPLDYNNGQVHNDRLLGKAFLLVAAGPAAFPDKLLPLFGGVAPAVGSWFVARPHDGIEVSVKGPGASRENRLKEAKWPCRLFLAKDLVMGIPDPSFIV